MLAVLQEIIGVLLILRGFWLCWTEEGRDVVDSDDLKYYLSAKMKAYMACGLIFVLMGILTGSVRLEIVIGAEALAAAICALVNLAVNREYTGRPEHGQARSNLAGAGRLAVK